MKIKDFTTGVQHIGIPTNDINKTIDFIMPWASRQPSAQ